MLELLLLEVEAAAEEVDVDAVRAAVASVRLKMFIVAVFMNLSRCVECLLDWHQGKMDAPTRQEAARCFIATTAPISQQKTRTKRTS